MDIDIKALNFIPIEELTDRPYYARIECVDGNVFYTQITPSSARDLAMKLLLWCDEVGKSKKF